MSTSLLPPRRPHRIRRSAPLGCSLLLAASLSAWSAGAPADGGQADWQFAGRLGIAQYLVVPQARANDRSYYDAVLDKVCEAGKTCFVRFFTNSTQAPVAVPLPDAIVDEATVIFQRSAKHQREEFRWSCRLQRTEPGCF